MTDAARGGRWEAILFDLDGTLADTIELILASYRHTMEVHLGQAPPDARWLATIGRPLHDSLREFSGDEAQAAAMLDTYVSFQRTRHDGMTRPYPGVPEVLDELAAGGPPMGIVTSKRSGIAHRTLSHCGILHHFETVVAADHVSRGKPDPEPVLLALSRMGVGRPSRVLFVGDSPHDLHAGRQGGVRTAAVLWGPHDQRALLEAEPDYVVEEVEELLHLRP